MFAESVCAVIKFAPAAGSLAMRGSFFLSLSLFPPPPPFFSRGWEVGWDGGMRKGWGDEGEGKVGGGGGGGVYYQ